MVAYNRGSSGKSPFSCRVYLTMSSSGRWGRNRLRKEIDSMLFERTAIATKPDELIKKELADLRDDSICLQTLIEQIRKSLEIAKELGAEDELQDRNFSNHRLENLP